MKLTDENVISLDEFLTTAAKKDISMNCEKAYYWVNAFSDDRKQVLLNYGCDNLGSRMFAVQASGEWKSMRVGSSRQSTTALAVGE